MAELADAADSKSADRKVVGVRPPLPAPTKQKSYSDLSSFRADGSFLLVAVLMAVGFLGGCGRSCVCSSDFWVAVAAMRSITDSL